MLMDLGRCGKSHASSVSLYSHAPAAAHSARRARLVAYDDCPVGATGRSPPPHRLRRSGVHATAPDRLLTVLTPLAGPGPAPHAPHVGSLRGLPPVAWCALPSTAWRRAWMFHAAPYAPLPFVTTRMPSWARAPCIRPLTPALPRTLSLPLRVADASAGALPGAYALGRVPDRATLGR
jgi:hypothetical protein